MTRVLFICGRNRRRSPTAEHLFRNHPGIEVQSAGLAPDADAPLERELAEWADLIFVMEERQRRKLNQQFGRSLMRTKVICLGIPDHYPFMDARLQDLLLEKVTPFLL